MFIRKYFYNLIKKYLSLYIRPQDKVEEFLPLNDEFQKYFQNYALFSGETSYKKEPKESPDYILLAGSLHYEADIQGLFSSLSGSDIGSARIIILYYSNVWKPLITLATALRIRKKSKEYNWITLEDVENFLLLSDLELIKYERKVLIPFYIPIFSNLINRYLAPLPFFRQFCVLNIAVAKKKEQNPYKNASVSIVVPARNEAGNIEDAMRRIPKMGISDEIIFIEGNSTDNTWEVIQSIAEKYKGSHRIKIAQQDGKGKGDAVRKGFSMAEKEILMILDADLTVPPEDLPKFYKAVVSGKGEFINGSRLVYPMEKNAMRFFNLIGNKFFAAAFSSVLGQNFRDTLCGTKVLSRENYLKIASHRSFFGDFDPFGDFDLIFGAARSGLKIVEVPISYKERVYGDTNIQRWKHGFLLLRMLIFAARKILFI